MHAFVLHLTRARARRANALQLAETNGLPGEIWAAVDGRTLTDQDMECAGKGPLFEPAYPFVLNKGEIGCFLSHRSIWAEIVRRDLDYALVLEDDVALDASVFAKALALATRNVARFGYVQLQNRPVDGAKTLIDQEGDLSLCLPEVTPVRASAQLISRQGAQTLLEYSAMMDRPVDTFVQSHWHTGLRPGVVYPSGVSTISDALEGSTIQVKTRSLGQKLKREVARNLYRRKVKRASRQSPAPIPALGEGA